MSTTQLSLYNRTSERSDTFVNDYKRRQRAQLVIAVVLTVLLGLLYLVANGNVAAPLGPFVLIGIVIVLWKRPDMLLPITVAGACLFETELYNFQDSLTDRVPLFWDVNTIFQVYGHADVHAVPFSLFEIILIIGAVFALIRGVYDRSLNLKGGTFIAPIAAYLFCVACGIANGLATGGDYHIALFEVRAQFYILFAYLIALNTGGHPRDVARTTMWVSAVCIGLKGILLTIRFLVTFGGKTNPDLGVGAHEESFFFNEFVALLFVLKMADIEPMLRRVMLCLLPFVLIANLANERRAATAALAVAVPVLLAMSFVAFPLKRRFIGGLVFAMVVLAAVYLPAFWNSDGVLAQPARAIRSNFEPSDRDQSSDMYRIQEDGNLMYTMRTSPIIGFGYGKPIYNTNGMVDVTNFDPLVMYITHDQILWVWMRLGAVGFIVFWVMISNFLIRSANVSADPTYDVYARATGVFVATTIAMLLVFGLYDIQLSNVRDVLLSNLWIGVLGAVLLRRAEQEEYARIKRVATMQRYLQPRRSKALGYSYMPTRSGPVSSSMGITRLSLDAQRAKGPTSTSQH